MVSEIAEYVGCDAAGVWFAVRNECDDNLSDDQAYVDGIKGDVINLETIDISDSEVRMEEMEVEEVDMKLDAAVVSTDEEDPRKFSQASS